MVERGCLQPSVPFLNVYRGYFTVRMRTVYILGFKHTGCNNIAVRWNTATFDAQSYVIICGLSINANPV